MDMTLAHYAGHRAGTCQRLRILALARMLNDDASCERIRQLFHSPLGVYVSQAQREGCALRLEFDVASEDLAFTLRTLRRVMPEARVADVGPRVFAYRERH